LNNPVVNEISGYTKLLEWVQSELNKEMKYITLLKYVQRKFKTKIKVARKSHIKKDKKAVDTFKKLRFKMRRCSQLYWVYFYVKN
jgi:hypothetical protein